MIGEKERGIPVEICGDGNCLPSSLSVALSEVDVHSQLLRLAAFLCLREEKETFLKKIEDLNLHQILISETSPEALILMENHLWSDLFDLEICRGLKDKFELGPLHIWAMAIVLKRPIRIVYSGPPSHTKEMWSRIWLPNQQIGEQITLFWMRAELVFFHSLPFIWIPG